VRIRNRGNGSSCPVPRSAWASEALLKALYEDIVDGAARIGGDTSISAGLGRRSAIQVAREDGLLIYAA
jgi:hypothetical protein